MMYFLDGCPKNLGPIVNVVKDFYNILLIVIPIILLVIGTVDLAKAVMAGDEKEIKGATGMLAKRAGAAVVVFILGLIINLVLGLVPNSGGWVACWGNPATGDSGDSGGNDTNILTCPTQMSMKSNSTITVNISVPVESISFDGDHFTLSDETKDSYTIKKIDDAVVKELVIDVETEDGKKDSCTVKMIQG